MADNDAARANFEELKGHITLASKRIKAMEPGSDNYNQTLDDLEDYYERTIQLRKMQAETALEERNDYIKKANTTSFIFKLIIFTLILVIVFQFIWLSPSAALHCWNSIYPYITIDRIILIIVLILLGTKKLK